MTRILLYEDNAGYRENLAKLLDTDPGLRVVGQYSDCRRLREQVDQHRPDLVLLDIDMPYVDGLQGLYLLKQHAPLVKALMLTIFDDNDKVFSAICLGADGYLLKHTAPNKILDALHDLFNGGAPMTPSIARKVLDLFPKSLTMKPKDYQLTEKERAVLSLLVTGKSYKMIAAEMDVTVNTVRTHIKGIYEKLAVHSAAEAIIKAIREQIV
jgi:DNA-binding NarL/FixJ family response regulator